MLNQLHPVPTTFSHFLKIHLNIILPSTPWSPQWSFSPRFPHQNPVHDSPFPHTRYMPRPFDFITRTILGVEHRSLKKAYTDIYVNTQQLLLNTTLFYTWRNVSAAHTAIFRPAYNRTGPFMCAQYGIPHCLHIKYK